MHHFSWQNSGLTTVVGEGDDGSEVALVCLGDDAEAGEGTFLAGYVQRRVAAVVGQPRVAARFQEPFRQVRLLRDHGKVQRRLQVRFIVC